MKTHAHGMHYHIRKKDGTEEIYRSMRETSESLYVDTSLIGKWLTKGKIGPVASETVDCIVSEKNGVIFRSAVSKDREER